MAEKINDILDLSKIEAGKLELNPAKTDIIQLLEVEESAEIFEYQTIKKNLKFILNIQKNIPHLAIVDPVRLKQILVNLLGNAVKFTEKGEVELKATFKIIDRTKSKIKFEVRDTGIGMKKNQNKLFKAFSQADSTITKKFGGTGLGLIISSSLAKKNGQ